MPDILERICADKRAEIAARRQAQPLADLRAAALDTPRGPSFEAALRGARRGIGLIAEVKRRSPSVGVIREPFVPEDIARAYARAGAECLSVLVDGPYFGGGEEAFRAVRAAVGIPLLYKEFVVSDWQIWHARLIGASAVLLIVAALTDDELARHIGEIRAAGLEPLVEVHDEAEMDRAARLDTGMIGINNRNLKTFVTDLATTGRLASLAPSGKLLVSESGIRDAADVARVRALGAGALLVGEHLLRKPDLEQAVRDLVGG